MWENGDTLGNIMFPHIENSMANQLGAPIMNHEILAAIRSLPYGKSPGPDGFPIEFYRSLPARGITILREMFNESFVLGRLPPTLLEVSITLLAKDNKDNIATRLQKVLPKIISHDQTGFMQERHSYHNTRRLLNIIATANTKIIIISLDAEKAFDRVEWCYLFKTLEKFGFPKNFIDWIRLLYNNPTASVVTNGIKSRPFPLHRGTRQGCPLSPLLFSVTIEPLAIWLRQEDRCKGVTRFGKSHKLFLYADDLLLYMSDPTASLPIALHIFEKFGALSGYKLNINKSEIMPINQLARNIAQTSFPFKY